uniref:Putative tail protein n=1 Tax=viral metagenome TaxID=1070528 RepID=A0A6M3JX91_9ZZZZ
MTAIKKKPNWGELLNSRTENSKTHNVGVGKRQLTVSMGAIHYKDDYSSAIEPWKDIDLTWEGNRITKAPYELTLDGQKITIRDKKSGDTSTIELMDAKPADLKWEIVPENTRVSFRHTLTVDNIPFEAKYKIDGKGGIRIRAFDDDGELEVETSTKDNIITERISKVTDKTTKLERPAKSKIKVDPTWQVGASTDDAYRKLTPSAWSLVENIYAGSAGTGSDYQYGSGMRFTDVGIPKGTTITSAYLTFRAAISNSSANCNTRISAEDVDNPATFADSSATFDTRWAARTTARVDWDGIAAWTLNTDYNSPEIKTVIQEIVDRTLWWGGNAIVIFWEDFEDRSPHIADNRRRAYSWDGSATYAPKLVVTYTVPALGATITTRIAFDSDPFDATPTWTDVSADMISLNTKRGRQHQLDRIEAGTATVLLKNIDGNYWPLNAGGDYYPEVKLGKRINIRVTYGAVTYDIYTGFVRKWAPTWFSKQGNLFPGMILSCSDLQRNIALTKLNDGSGYSEEASGTRIGNVLDDMGWVAANGRDLDTGSESVQATGALVNVNAMEHLFAVQESELGTLFIAGNGDTVYNARGSLEAKSSLGIFGTGGFPIFDPKFPLDDELLYNEIRLTRIGGTEQTYSDASSIVDYGTRTLSRSGLLLISDTIVLIYCFYLLARYQDAKMRIKSFTVKPQAPGYETDLWPLVLGIELEDKITLVWTEATIDNDYFVEGIEHTFDGRDGVWVTKYQCTDAAQYYYEPDAMDYTIRPNAAGDKTECVLSGAATNWECVDEVTADEDTTYVHSVIDGVQQNIDLYNLDNIPFTGTINKVTVYVRWRIEGAPGGASYNYIMVKTNGSESGGSGLAISNTSYANVSRELTLNPITAAAWTFTEVQALQAGVSIYRDDPWYPTVRVTQVWVVVNITPTW